MVEQSSPTGLPDENGVQQTVTFEVVDPDWYRPLLMEHSYDPETQSLMLAAMIYRQTVDFSKPVYFSVRCLDGPSVWADMDTSTEDYIENYAPVYLADYGTVTLEAALCGLGCEILYKSSPLSFWIAKRVVEIPHIGLPNIVAGRLIEPELLQDDCTPEKIASTAMELLEPERYAQLQRDLQEVKKKLGEPGAVKRVAELVLRMARQNRE